MSPALIFLVHIGRIGGGKDPSGKGEEEFKNTIMLIEEKVLDLKERVEKRSLRL